MIYKVGTILSCVEKHSDKPKLTTTLSSFKLRNNTKKTFIPNQIWNKQYEGVMPSQLVFKKVYYFSWQHNHLVDSFYFDPEWKILGK